MSTTATRNPVVDALEAARPLRHRLCECTSITGERPDCPMLLLTKALPIARAQAARERALRDRVAQLEGALLKAGKCRTCDGDGKPQCIGCHDYQFCRCKPGKGIHAAACWNCRGSGLQEWAAQALGVTGEEAE